MRSPYPKSAVVLHIYYLDVAERLLGQLSASTEKNYALWVTVPYELSAEAQRLVARYHPSARVRSFDNLGNDVLPFLRVLPELVENGYKAVLKLHTKRGADETSAIWGRALSDTVTSPSWIDYVFDRLAASPELDVVGPGPYFCSARRLMLDNRPTLEYLWSYFPSELPLPEDWGFFIGTMFAVRPERLLPLARWACDNAALFDTQYQKDGLLAHAIERVFALFARRSLPSIGLVHTAQTPGRYAVQKVSVSQGLNQAYTRPLAGELPEYQENARLLCEAGLLEGQEYPLDGEIEGDLDLYSHYLLIGQFDQRGDCIPAWVLKKQSENTLPWDDWLRAKPKPGLVSVIIPVFNEPALTDHCIRTLFAVGADTPFEVVCVDNGSEAPTQSVLSDLAQAFKGLRVVRNEKNLNFALGCNIGFGHARGETVVFLNNDAEVQPGWLDALIKRLAVGDCYGVQPQLRYPDGRLQCMGVVFSEKSTLGYPVYAGMSTHECSADKPRTFKALTAACFGLRAIDFARARGFDAIYINGQEDVDLCLRLHRDTGKLGAYVPDSKVIHQESKTEGRFKRVDQNRKVFVHRWKGKVAPDDAVYYREDGFSIVDWQSDGSKREEAYRIHRPKLEQVGHLQLGHKAFVSGWYQEAAMSFLSAAFSRRGDFYGLAANFAGTRRRWLTSRAQASRAKVGVCSWSLDHNPAGRAMTLAEAYAPHADVEIVGCLVPQFGAELWPPLRGSAVPCHYFTVASGKEFVRQALKLVVQHPYDIVHLSKPRSYNVIFGWLYQLVWGARVIMDVDDEELAFAKAQTALDPFDYIREHGALPSLESLRSKEWTRLAVGMVSQFDRITVSNPALQRRYGGAIIPHVRPLARFRPCATRQAVSRAEFNVPQDKKVFLFYGTPRKHKGVVETARALAQLGRDDICYVIAGAKPSAELRTELERIRGLDIQMIGPQSYERTADIVAMGDACVLLQDADSLVAQFQLPAKLVDALGMGLTVFAQVTPALEELAKKGAFIPVTPDTLVDELRAWIESGDKSQGKKGRSVFEADLTVEAVAPIIRDILADDSPRRARLLGWEGQLDRLMAPDQLPLGVPLPL